MIKYNLLNQIFRQILPEKLIIQSFKTRTNLQYGLVLKNSRCLSTTFSNCSKNKSNKSYNNDNYNNNNNKNNRNQFKDGFKYSLGAIGLTLLSVNEDGNNKESKVKRYNFIADTVENVISSIVQIEVFESSRFGTVVVANGSGFIVSEDGVILTNAHVVRNSNEVNVKLNDGRKLNGKVIKVDLIADVAAVRIDCKELKYLKLGDSSKVRPGEFAIALGSPLSLSNSVTAGVISNISRDSSELGLSNEMEYIQSDVLITVGNSGGPLVNLDGEVIGMNTMKAVTGISFAVPSNYMQTFLTEVLDERKYWKNKNKTKRSNKRYYIGMKVFSLRPDIIDALRQRGDFLNVPNDYQHGCYVASVAPNSPAEKIGIHAGDIIIKANGKDIYKTSEFFDILQETPHLHLNILRGNKELKFILNADEI